MAKNIYAEIFVKLYEQYGAQGWWPLLDCRNESCPLGYHLGDYFKYPTNEKQRFEICVGAILTQNTSWKQVERALINLQGAGLLLPSKMLSAPDEKLEQLIKLTGYFKQKRKKLKIFCKYFISLSSQSIPSRDELLSLWGIGPETADSILLYAYNQPSFVIDAYTKRIFSNLGISSLEISYLELQSQFHNSKFFKYLPAKYKALKIPLYALYQEYHALIVTHAKSFYSKKPYPPDIILR